MMHVQFGVSRRQVIKTLITLGGSCLISKAVAEESPPAPRRETWPANRNAPWLTLPQTPALPATSRSGIAEINRTSVFFAQFGEGPPVLLLHGGLANSNYWGRQIAELAKNYSVIVMDTRGHGRSPVTSNSFSYGIFANDVIALLDFLKIPVISIVGWSDGGVTGLQLAITEPSRVSRLFAFGANSALSGLKANGSRSQVFAVYSERCKAEYPRLSPRPDKWPQLVNGLRGMWHSEPNFRKETLAAVRVPTTIAYGEFDEIIKREHAEFIAATIPGARLVVLPEVSHFAMLQSPALFTGALTEFLSV